MSLAEYFEKMNVNKKVGNKGLELLTHDIKANRMDISPLETTNSAMIRYSKLNESEQDQQASDPICK